MPAGGSLARVAKRVFQVKAGPRRSRAAKLVTSFITEAGFIGSWTRWAMTGGVASRSCTSTAHRCGNAGPGEAGVQRRRQFLYRGR